MRLAAAVDDDDAVCLFAGSDLSRRNVSHSRKHPVVVDSRQHTHKRKFKSVKERVICPPQTPLCVDVALLHECFQIQKKHICTHRTRFECVTYAVFVRCLSLNEHHATGRSSGWALCVCAQCAMCERARDASAGGC